jgi:hypothetical protein
VTREVYLLLGTMYDAPMEFDVALLIGNRILGGWGYD